MKYLFTILLLPILIYLSGMYTPFWWSFILVCYFFGAFILRSKRIFWTCFFSVFAVWSLYAFSKDVYNQHILSEKIAVLFSLPSGYVLIFVVALIGGLLGGLSGWAGAQSRKAFA